MAKTVVLYTALAASWVKFGGLAFSQRAVHAALPYGLSVSVAEMLALGSHFPQVVYDCEGIRDTRLSGGEAWVVVVVGAGREVAYRTVEVMVYAKGVYVYCGSPEELQSEHCGRGVEPLASR